jgi:hypothetical protein
VGLSICGVSTETIYAGRDIQLSRRDLGVDISDLIIALSTGSPELWFLIPLAPFHISDIEERARDIFPIPTPPGSFTSSTSYSSLVSIS